MKWLDTKEVTEESMNITEQDLADQRELIQDDLMCILTECMENGWGLDDQILNRVCQVIINRIKILEDKLEEFTCKNGDWNEDEQSCGDTGLSAWHDCPT